MWTSFPVTRVSFFPIYLGSSFWFKAKFRGVLERVLLKDRRAPWRSGKRGMERNHWFELDIWGVHGSVWRIMFNCWVVNWNICGNWGRFSFWLILFSNGLKPPTRVFFHCWSLLNRCVYNFQCYVCVYTLWVSRHVLSNFVCSPRLTSILSNSTGFTFAHRLFLGLLTDWQLKRWSSRKCLLLGMGDRIVCKCFILLYQLLRLERRIPHHFFLY